MFNQHPSPLSPYRIHYTGSVVNNLILIILLQVRAYTNNHEL